MKEQEAIELLTQERDNDIFAGTEHREKIHEAITMGIEALRFMERIHFNPFPEYADLFRKVEAALGFELFTWQKTFIASGLYRRYGDTTARILKRLLTEKTPLDLSNKPIGSRQYFERKQTVDIYEKLTEAGIETCEVKFRKPPRQQSCYPTKMPEIPEEEKKDVWFDYDMRTNELILHTKTETKRIPCDNLIRREFYENNTAALLEAFRQ